MSTDYQDPQLDELLAGYAGSWNSGFAAPPLAGMLEQATSRPNHHRWLLAAVAAVLLLVVPVATVLVLHRSRSADQPGNRAPKPTGSVTERSLGTTPWNDARLMADGSTVAVEVSMKVPCGQPIPFPRASVIRTTPTTITITTTLYLRSDAPLVRSAPGFGCSNSPDGIIGATATVKLANLTGRHLIDGSTGQQHQFLDIRSVASPTFVPRGFVDDGVYWDETRFAQQPDVQHSYHNGQGTLTIDRLTFRDPVGDQPIGETEVGPIHGHTGQWMAGLGQLSWLQGDYVWTISQVAYNGTGKVQLDLKTVLKIANSLP
jgi:hypothetical protein